MTDERTAPTENGSTLTAEIRRCAVLPRVTAIPAAELLSPSAIFPAEDASAGVAVVPLAADKPLPDTRPGRHVAVRGEHTSRARVAVLGAIAAVALVAVPIVVLSSGGGNGHHSSKSAAGDHEPGTANQGAPPPSWAPGDPSPGTPVNSGTPAPARSPGHSTPGSKNKAGGKTGSGVNPPPGGTAHHPSGSTTTDSTRLVMSHASNRCIDVSGGTGKDGTPLDIWDCVGGARMKWKFESDGTVRAMGMCMDVAWGSSDDGTTIQLARCHGGPAQHFDLNSAGDLVNTGADKCVDVKDKSTGNGTHLQLWSCRGTSNQKWSAV